MAEELEKSWYVKYRPSTFKDYAGSEIRKIVEKRFNKRANMPHVIFISGNRGCGKTTFCRLISKFYTCLNPNEDGTPCEECEMCQAINETLIAGESGVECPGVTEVDATTANGKEAIQEVMDDALIAPIYGDFKVLIMDECHMFSNAAQNSLLKLIEDIPQHLVVMFATTDPQKVLQTIKSRCQLKLEVKKQTVDDMANRLETISKLEKLNYSKEALQIIAKKGDRVPRECINLLESIAKTYDRTVQLEQVRDYLGDVSSSLYLDYFKASNKSLTEILLFIKKLKDDNIKVTDFVNGLMQFVLDSMYIKHGIAIEDYPPEYIKSIKELFDEYNSSDFDVLLQIIEYLSNTMTAEDSSKNDILLTTTAMRISKIELLANGLANESNQAIAENKISLYEHSKKLKADNDKISEQLKIDITPMDIKEQFGDIRQVTNTQGLLDAITLPDLNISLDNEQESSNNRVNLGSEVDEFFNT